MMRRFNLFLVITAVLALTAQPALADFWGGVNTPDWSANAHYTNQTWTFTDEVTWMDQGDGNGIIMPPISADAGYTNAYSSNGAHMPITYPGFYNFYYGSSFAAGWMDQGAMGQDWDGLQGMLGGMGQFAMDFYAPIADVTGTTSVWLQYVSYLPNGLDGSAVNAQLASDSGITALVGTQTYKDYMQIHELDDQGGTGDWWLITEEWEVDNAGDLLFLRVNADGSPGTANILDSVQVMTSANTVPVPGALWLMASGLIGLAGLTRRRR